MASATLHFNLVQRRIVDQKQAAVYLGMKNGKKFEATCPVRAVMCAGGELGYDLRDLDDWIDSLKTGDGGDTESLVRRLH